MVRYLVALLRLACRQWLRLAPIGRTATPRLSAVASPCSLGAIALCNKSFLLSLYGKSEKLRNSDLQARATSEIACFYLICTIHALERASR